METRCIQQIKIHKLILNPMRGRCEESRIVAISPDKQKLIYWYENEKATESWKDDNWHKTFKKGSPLEWFNPIGDLDNLSSFGHGIYEEWINEEIFQNIQENSDLIIVD